MSGVTFLRVMLWARENPVNINDSSLFEAALIGYRIKLKKLDDKIAEVRSQLSGEALKAVADINDGEGKRGLTPEARARIAAAQKKRWAAFHKEADPKVPATKKKRVLSPAARKRIADATRKRWAAYRAQKAA